MNRIKVQKDTNYTTINNTVIKDKYLSLKAKGLFLTIMSLPNDWDFSISGIAAVILEGEKAVYHAINELIERGYCQRERVYENGKIKEWSYTFIEQTSASELLRPNVQVENLQVENLLVQKVPQLSKEGIKEKLNKEEARNAPAAATIAETENLSQETPPTLTTFSVQKPNALPRRLSSDEAAAMLDREPVLAESSEAENIYRDFFGAVYLKPHQLKLMNDAVKDFKLWTRVCDIWFNNGHNATNIHDLVDRYGNELAKQPKYDEKGFMIHSTKPVAKWYH
jgi:hypothetical protein